MSHQAIDPEFSRWEYKHREELEEVYQTFFENNRKFDCDYWSFVYYCYYVANRHGHQRSGH